VQAVKSTEQGIAVVEVDDPAVGRPEDGVVVEVRSASICGSDLHLVGYGALPCTMGHEFAGMLEDGTPVAVDPNAPCGSCDLCAEGRTNLCRNLVILGVSRDGGMAERVLVHPDAVVRLPAGVRTADACLVEPLAVAIHGLRLAGIDGGSRLAVVGAGSIGLTAVAAATATGAEVQLEARHEAQRLAGERLGATGPATGEYDLVIEAAGSQSAVERAVELLRPGGTVVFLSTPWDPVTMPGLAAAMKEATFRWSFTYGHHAAGRDVDAAAALLARRPEIADTLITHRFPLADAPEAFRVAADRAHGAIKVVLEPE
jgi:2-desacetyl-2-hydroxyethyl bacteriochlorophyllide A dehydrogenase